MASQPAKLLESSLVDWLLAAFPILLVLGFSPVTSVAISSVGSAWAVSYGTLSSAIYALLAATGYPGELLALPAAEGMGAAYLLCGAGAPWTARPSPPRLGSRP